MGNTGVCEEGLLGKEGSATRHVNMLSLVFHMILVHMGKLRAPQMPWVTVTSRCKPEALYSDGSKLGNEHRER